MKIAVVGAGITGMFASYYLRKAGHEVTLIEKTTPIAYTSMYNAGYLAPSFISTKGAKAAVSVWYLASTMFGPRGPIYISPREVLKNLGWFRRATSKLTGFEENVKQAAIKSHDMYRQFFKEETIDADVIQGLCALYKTAEAGKSAAEELGGRFVDGREIKEMGFNNLEGGFVVDELSINPYKLFKGLRQRLPEMGVSFRTGKDVKLLNEGRNISSVSLDGNRFAADAFVVSAGASCKELLGPLGYDPPILPGIGRALIFDTGGAKITQMPAMLEEIGISVVQHNSTTLRATSFFELQGFNTKFPESRKKWLLNVVSKHVQNYGKMKLIDEGVGFRPCSPDQLPIIGAVSGYDNLYIASGACRVGVTLAPVTGYIIQSLIDGKEPDGIPWRSFDPARFSQQN